MSRSGLEPARVADLSALRAIGSSGSPLPAEVHGELLELSSAL